MPGPIQKPPNLKVPVPSELLQVGFPSRLMYEGVPMARNATRANEKGGYTGYYRCPTYRHTNCPARLLITIPDNWTPKLPVQTALTRDHDPATCDSRVFNAPAKISAVHRQDLRQDMKLSAAAKAISDVTKSATTIANEVMADFNQKYASTAYDFLTDKQLKKIVYTERQHEFADIDSMIRSFPLANVSEDDVRLFLLFNLEYSAASKGEKIEKMIGWGHPDAIWLTQQGPRSYFFDATFKV